MTEEERMAIKAVKEYFMGSKVILKDSPENKDLDAWIKAGEPIVLYKMDQIDTVSFWGDCGHGHVFLIHEDQILDASRDFVSADFDGYVYIGLSEAYSEHLEGLYRREIKC